MRNKLFKRFGAALLAATMVLSSFGGMTVAQAAEETASYEIYPTPHEIEYGEGSWALGEEAKVTYESGIDDATKDRLEETLALQDMTIADNADTEILVGIYGSGETVDAYVEANYEVSAELFDKTDAYFLTSDNGKIVVLGATADAAYYGLTTVYHVFAQITDGKIMDFAANDWADVVSRGFIEGYYGNPWSLEDRCKLMEWGGYYKLNSYFYAPKDDPKHNASWRELYTQEELDTLIKPLADAGNASKCRFVYALHPFMYNAVSFSSEERYQADLAVVQAKFEQVISAGVRQIAILADDAANVGSSNYIKFLNDMTAWLAKMQKEYPDLKQTLPFCTQEYMGNGLGYYAQFPENVQIVMTGGRVWGEVSNNFTSTFTNNVGRGPYMWINWPCSDNSKNHLIMGGYSTFLHPGVDASKIQGIVLNPMQQSEPSKVAIFGNAAYSWNIWETAEEADLAWENSFKYVDNNCAIETESSSALRELSRHMINQNMDSRVTALQESLNIKEDLSAFRAALSSGTATAEECDALIEVFAGLKEAAAYYKANPGDERIRDQIIYWLDCWADTTDAAIAYLEAIKGDISGDNNALITKYSEGKTAFVASKKHGFDYMGGTQYAEVGVQHIVPFISAMEDYVSGKVKLVLDPTAVLKTYITSRTDTPTGDKADVMDGDYASGVIYKTPNAIYAGDFVGVMFTKAVDIDNMRFVLGAGKDHFDEAKIQYTMDGSEWVDLDETVYTGVQGQAQDIALTEEDLPADFKAMGVRLVATVDNAKDAWLEVREVEVNKEEKSGTDDGSSDINYTVMKPSTWAIYSGSESSLFDGDDNSYIWYNPGTQCAVNDYLGYDLGEVLKLQSVHAVIGAGDTDKFLEYAIEISVDGQTWENVKSCSGVESGKDVVDVELNGVEARYVRIRNTERRNYWIKFSEFTVQEVPVADGRYVYSNIPVELFSERSGNSISLLGEAVTLEASDYVGLKLTNIKLIENIDVTELPEGLVLQTSKNAIEWTEYEGGQADARYVRVYNKSDAAVAWTYDTFTVKFYEVGEYKVTSDFANGSSDRDVRSLGNVANVFDGDLTTFAEVTGAQIAGKVVTFDLGRTIDFESVRYYITETNMDYPRSMVLEVADSEDSEEWTTVLTIKKEGFENIADSSTAKDMQDNGLFHDNANPGYMYAEAADLDVSGRFIRARIVDTYDGRWLAFNEIQINGGEYSSMEDARDIVSEAVEVPYMIPSNMLDGDIDTSYLSSAQDSSFTYYVSEPEGIKTLRFVQFGEVSNAVVTAAFTDGTVGYGKLNQCINDFNIPEDKVLSSVKVEWTDVIPEIAEIMTFDQALETGEDFGNDVVVPTPTPTPTPGPTNPFKDVPDTKWYAEAVLWGAETDIVAGIKPDMFYPNESCTRAQIVAFLWRAENRPEPTSTETKFTDINSSKWYYKAVLWASEKGIVSGYGENTFAPNETCTRAEMAAFIWRLKGREETTSSENPFTDLSENKWYTKAAQWAYENGIVSGYNVDDGTAFAPDNTIKRAETVTMLYRLYK